MGIKSTVTLNRYAAESLFHDFKKQLTPDDDISGLTNEQLADYLEMMDDALAGGESFNNYWVNK